MTSTEIYEHYSGHKCHACNAWKRKQLAFCWACYGRLPNLLRSSLWKSFGSGYESAYQGCLSWFRLHPLLFGEAPPSEKPKQEELFQKRSRT